MLGLLKLTRFPLVFTAMADSAAGYLLVVGTGSIRWLPLVTVMIISGLFYAAGMVYNDLGDFIRDKVLHPERPLPSGRVSRDAAHRFARSLLLVAVGGTALFGFWASIWAMAMLVLILGYDFNIKQFRIPGSIAMGSIRALNLGLGGLAAMHLVPASLEMPRFILLPWAAMGILGLYVTILTIISTHEEGPPKPRTLANLGTALIGVPMLGMIVAKSPWMWSALAPSLLVAPFGARAAVVPTPQRIMQFIRWSVLAIILLDASFVLGAGLRIREGLAIAALALPAVALFPVFRKL